MSRLPLLRLHGRWLGAALLGAALAACPSGSTAPVANHSSSIAVASDGRTLYVVNADADSVSVIDLEARALEREILLASTHPSPDPASGAFAPAVMPRALALSPD